MEKVGNFRGIHGDSERQPNNQKHTPPPPPTYTGEHMYRLMCIAGAIIGIVFVIVLIKAMKDEII